MRNRLALWMLILGGISISGCTTTQHARVNIIEPSYSYVDDMDMELTASDEQTLAQVPIQNHVQP
ncbi:MAG TPA: hypothetical protein DCM28_20090 [Phycisphaerales bacterium]|nr:hypothetical protein [Phycisphaerales bacterium]HCD33689.1 hypothetical protein [Phycisphaerales bacterium]